MLVTYTYMYTSTCTTYRQIHNEALHAHEASEEGLQVRADAVTGYFATSTSTLEGPQMVQPLKSDLERELSCS